MPHEDVALVGGFSRHQWCDAYGGHCPAGRRFESISIALGPRAEALIMARCSVCHTADLITQQRMPPARWEATVDKMKHWGPRFPRRKPAFWFAISRRAIIPTRQTACRRSNMKSDWRSRWDRSPLRLAARRRGQERSRHLREQLPGLPRARRNRRTGPEAFQKSDSETRRSILGHRAHGRGPMPAWGSILSEQDIADIHAWLLTR